MSGSGARIGRWVRAHRVLTVLLVPLLFLLWEVISLPWIAIYRLKDENPQETSLMRQRMEEAKDAGKRLEIVHPWIPIRRIPKHMLDAVVIAEDGMFYSHSGFDWFEVRESLMRNMEEGRAARGASTITQQLAKNLYLSTSKTILRKLEEAAMTLLLEQLLTKNRILEVYVNVIEWGPGVFGIEAASRRYFGKSAAELSVDESLRLAAVIPSPLRHRPDGDGTYVTRRVKMLRDRMSRYGKLQDE